MKSSLRVLVLAGGLSHERDVSLRSGRRVAEVLRDEGLEVQLADADAHLIDLIDGWRPHVVFPVLHGVAGEDGGVRAVLELLGTPYVGAAPSSCRLAFDKAVARTIVAREGLTVPEGVALTHTTFRELGAQRVLAALVGRIGVPLVVKPTSGGSSLGMSVVRTPEALPAGMVHAYSYGDTALVERFVEGTEVAVSVIEDMDGSLIALPAVEIVPDGGVYDYNARYTAGMTEFFSPARLDGAGSAAAAAAAVTAHRALGLRDVSRTDMVVDPDGCPWFFEVNVAPGMTETSLLPQAVLAGGRSLGEVYRLLVERAAARS